MKTHQKILKLSALLKKLPSLRRKREIAFTNGCFDIVHYGHVQYLEKAKKDKRILIVGLNSDRSVKAIKGPNRPIIGEQARAALLAALACIDYVVIFEEETPLKLIQAIKPDVLIKGADWKGKTVVGADAVKSYSGRVEFVHYVPKFSTTNIIEEIVRKCAKR